VVFRPGNELIDWPRPFENPVLCSLDSTGDQWKILVDREPCCTSPPTFWSGCWAGKPISGVVSNQMNNLLIEQNTVMYLLFPTRNTPSMHQRTPNCPNGHNYRRVSTSESAKYPRGVVFSISYPSTSCRLVSRSSSRRVDLLTTFWPNSILSLLFCARALLARFRRLLRPLPFLGIV